MARPIVLLVEEPALIHAAVRGALGDRFDIMRTSRLDADRALSEHCVELVILRLDADPEPGLALCRRWRRERATQDHPVVIVADRPSDEIERRGLEAGAVDVVRGIGDPTILALRLVNQIGVKRLRERAALDEETSVGNRRHFEEELIKEWYRAMRLSSPLSVILVDLAGPSHAADLAAVLAASRQLSATLFRPGDSISRYGDHSFALILPQTGIEGAETVATRIRLALGDERPGAPAIGIAWVVPTINQDPLSLLKRANDAMAVARANAPSV